MLHTILDYIAIYAAFGLLIAISFVVALRMMGVK